MGHERGLNSAGHLIIIGGYQYGIYRANDMWIIPQGVCAIVLAGSSYSYAYFMSTCSFNESFVGDGRTCTAIVEPKAQVPISDSSPSANPTSTPSTAVTTFQTPSKVSYASSTAIHVVNFFVAFLLVL
jgi:hypothetical protein